MGGQTKTGKLNETIEMSELWSTRDVSHQCILYGSSDQTPLSNVITRRRVQCHLIESYSQYSDLPAV